MSQLRQQCGINVCRTNGMERTISGQIIITTVDGLKWVAAVVRLLICSKRNGVVKAIKIARQITRRRGIGDIRKNAVAKIETAASDRCQGIAAAEGHIG